MMKKKFVQFLLIFLLMSVGLIVFNYSHPSLVSAQSGTRIPKISFPRPQGSPGAKNTTGSRGNCPPVNFLVGRENSVYIKTAGGYPTFWFYVPPQNKIKLKKGELEIQERAGNKEITIAKVAIEIPEKAQIVPIRINRPLTEDKIYTWYFSYDCANLGNKDLTKGVVIPNSLPSDFTKGVVQKNQPTEQLNQELKSASSSIDRVGLYAQNSYWYDTLTEFAQLYKNQPEYKEAWADFLKDADLEDISDLPISSAKVTTQEEYYSQSPTITKGDQ